MTNYEPPQKKARPYESLSSRTYETLPPQQQLVSNGNQTSTPQQMTNGYQNGVCDQSQMQQYTSSAQQPNVVDEHGMLASALANKTKPCTKFFSTSGCPYGEGCHFMHYVPGGTVSLGLPSMSTMSASNLTTATNGVRNQGNGVGVGSIPMGVVSGASADPSVTVGGYKTRLCNRFNTPEGCRFAEKCHFAHGESDLRPSNTRGASNASRSAIDYLGHMGVGVNMGSYTNGAVPSAYISPSVATALYYGEPTPPGVATFGSMSTTKISIEAMFAGAIIGKAGSNVKQISRITGAKLSIREHETDPNMRNVEMEGSLEQIESASEMVRQFLQNREVATPKTATLGSHNFKTKMCENFVQGTCTFADRCHFAHGQSELRGPATAMR